MKYPGWPGCILGACAKLFNVNILLSMKIIDCCELCDPTSWWKSHLFVEFLLSILTNSLDYFLQTFYVIAAPLPPSRTNSLDFGVGALQSSKWLLVVGTIFPRGQHSKAHVQSAISGEVLTLQTRRGHTENCRTFPEHLLRNSAKT